MTIIRTFPLAAVLALSFVLTGCSWTRGSRTLPDGSTLAISNYRAVWASEGIEATTKDKQGFEFSLKVQKSTTDAAALGAVAKGVAEGLAAGAK